MQVSQQTHTDERLVLLAMALDSRVGLTFDELREKGLLGDPQGSDEALHKALTRACKSFDELGIKVVDEIIGGERRYRIEARLTYAQPSEVTLDPQTAPDLLAAVTAYLQGSQRPYDGDVRRAREKLASVLGLSSSPIMTHLHAQKESIVGEDIYHGLLRCRTDHVECTFTYRDAKGVCATHTVRPYGFFDRNGKSYVVAFDILHIDSEPIRVFRIDRIDQSGITPSKKTYTIPDDFDINDYIKLPFEYGGEDTAFTARFVCESDRRAALDTLTCGRGTWAREADGWSWTIEARDLAACANWAIEAHFSGLIAKEPDDLLSAMLKGLNRTVTSHA